MPVKPIPDGYHTATPYLSVDGASSALDFYKKAFGATERMRMPGPGGKVMHAEMMIGDSTIMLADIFPGSDCVNPLPLGGSPVSIMLYVEDVDSVIDQAVAAGAEVIRPVQDHFYGDRAGAVKDPFGHRWHVATHKEDVSPEEMHRRMAAFTPPAN